MAMLDPEALHVKREFPHEGVAERERQVGPGPVAANDFESVFVTEQWMRDAAYDSDDAHRPARFNPQPAHAQTKGAARGKGNRRPRVLTLQQRLEIANSTEGTTTLSLRYRVGDRYIRRIRFRAEEIRKMAAEAGISTVSSVVESSLDAEDESAIKAGAKPGTRHQKRLLDRAMYKWSLQKCAMGETVMGYTACEKATKLNQLLGGPMDFRASDGWLRRFKKRHGVRYINPMTDPEPSNRQATQAFFQDFRKKVRDSQVQPDLMFNVEEAGLRWKAVPRSCAWSAGVYRERVAIVLCANATGTFRFPPLVVGQPILPELREEPSLRYVSGPAPCIDPEVFTVWFQQELLPAVQRWKLSEGLRGKVLLVLDDSPTHPAEYFLRDVGDPMIEIRFLPPGASAKVQPMERWMANAVKREYRRDLLRRLSIGQDVSLPAACAMLTRAWHSLPAGTLAQIWDNLLHKNPSSGPPAVRWDDAADFLPALRTLPGCEQSTEDDVRAWLDLDRSDIGLAYMTDEEIVTEVLEESRARVSEDMMPIGGGGGDLASDDDEAIPAKRSRGMAVVASTNEVGAPVEPTATEAMGCLLTAMRWLRRQPDCPAHTLAGLADAVNFTSSRCAAENHVNS